MYKIKADKAFCDSLEDGNREIKEEFTSSVKKVIIEEEVKKLEGGLTNLVEN